MQSTGIGNSCLMQCNKNQNTSLYNPNDSCIFTANGKITCDNNNYPWLMPTTKPSNKFEQKILEPGKDSGKYTKFIIGDMF